MHIPTWQYALHAQCHGCAALQARAETCPSQAHLQVAGCQAAGCPGARISDVEVVPSSCSTEQAGQWKPANVVTHTEMHPAAGSRMNACSPSKRDMCSAAPQSRQCSQGFKHTGRKGHAQMLHCAGRPASCYRLSDCQPNSITKAGPTTYTCSSCSTAQGCPGICLSHLDNMQLQH